MIEQSELVNADVATAKNANSDHRLLSVGDQRVLDLVEQLKAAVDSIPSYVERSAMMWILVPPCKHQDLEGAICDKPGWWEKIFDAAIIEKWRVEAAPLLAGMTDESPEVFDFICAGRAARCEDLTEAFSDLFSCICLYLWPMGRRGALERSTGRCEAGL